MKSFRIIIRMTEYRRTGDKESTFPIQENPVQRVFKQSK